MSKRVTGTGATDNEEHTGRICSFTYRDDSGLKVKWIWIFDEDTMKRVALIPSTVEIVKDEFIPYIHRMNPFSTNMMHLHEHDVDGEYLSHEVERWRDFIVSELHLNKNIVTYLNDKFVYNQYDNNAIQLYSFHKKDFFYLLGLDEKSTKKEVTDMFNRFISMYCLMKNYHLNKLKIYISKDTVEFRNDYGKRTDDFALESWIDLYSFVICILFCKNMNNHNEDSDIFGDEEYRKAMKFMIESMVPFIDFEKNGERVFIER